MRARMLLKKDDGMVEELMIDLFMLIEAFRRMISKV